MSGRPAFSARPLTLSRLALTLSALALLLLLTIVLCAGVGSSSAGLRDLLDPEAMRP